jgi:TfoX-like protein
MAPDPELTDRIRRVLGGRPDIEEKRMVGGLSFSVAGRMCCGVSGRALMVRVGADARESVLGLRHVRPMVLGAKVVTGFVLVDPEGVATDRDLEAWVGRGLDVASGLPADGSRSARGERQARGPLTKAAPRPKRRP